MNKLEAFRKRAGLTQQELADKIGLSRVQIARAENYTYDFKGAVWVQLAKVLDCTTDALLGKE